MRFARNAYPPPTLASQLPSFARLRRRHHFHCGHQLLRKRQQHQRASALVQSLQYQSVTPTSSLSLRLSVVAKEAAAQGSYFNVVCMKCRRRSPFIINLSNCQRAEYNAIAYLHQECTNSMVPMASSLQPCVQRYHGRDD